MAWGGSSSPENFWNSLLLTTGQRDQIRLSHPATCRLETSPTFQTSFITRNTTGLEMFSNLSTTGELGEKTAHYPDFSHLQHIKDHTKLGSVLVTFHLHHIPQPTHTVLARRLYSIKFKDRHHMAWGSNSPETSLDQHMMGACCGTVCCSLLGSAETLRV